MFFSPCVYSLQRASEPGRLVTILRLQLLQDTILDQKGFARSWYTNGWRDGSFWFLQPSVAGICFRMLPYTRLGDMVSPCRTPPLMLILLLSLCRWTVVELICWCIYPSVVRCTHLLSPVLEARSVLLEFALNRRLSRSRRIRCRVGYHIMCSSPSVGLRRGCGLSLSSRFWIQLALVAGFRRVSSLAFSLELSWILYRCLLVYILTPFVGSYYLW